MKLPRIPCQPHSTYLQSQGMAIYRMSMRCPCHNPPSQREPSNVYRNILPFVAPTKIQLFILSVGPLPPNTCEIDIEDENETDSDNSSEESDESEDDLLPPTIRRQQGRPRKVGQDKLNKSRGAIKKVQKCKLCQGGHSSRTCKNLLLIFNIWQVCSTYFW